jgi:aldehyde dehydrogenase (NAD+)
MTTAAPAAPPRTETVPQLLERLRATFRSGRTRPLEWRLDRLHALRALLKEREAEAFAALRADLGKPALEAYAGEVGFALAELDHTLKHLASWVRPERVPTPIANFKATSTIRRDPLGVVLIIGPWNYPLQLLVGPLVGALAAGNCAVLKPSELAPRTSALVARWFADFAPDAVAVVEGGVPETTTLLEQRWDHIFFTGSTNVGKVVMAAAAKHLTPVTLELGGKSPCIVDEDVDLDVAARRIVWGKFWNAGQTCVAPDHLLVHEAVARPFEERLVATIREFYGEDPQQSPDYARIVSERHHRRLVGMLGQGELVTGGQHDAESRYLAPTLLREPPAEAQVMQEEIFGPILPLLTVRNVGEAIERVNAGPKPLALYVFSNDRGRQEQVLSETSSGGACVNDTIAHLTVPDLPFGGVGDSGMGAYHGRTSFETFSHRKGVMAKSNWPDVKLRYPPYADRIKWVKRLM